MKLIFIALIVVGLIGTIYCEYSRYAHENSMKNVLDNQTKILDNQNKILGNQDVLLKGQLKIFNTTTNDIADISKKIDILLNIATQANSEVKLKN